MLKTISNTSPLLYLYRIGAINWFPELFDEVWTPEAVKNELLAGHSKGYDVPNLADYPWLNIVNPKSMPPEWLALDGATLLDTRCSVCHSTERVKQAKKTNEQWDQTVTRMVGKGAQLTESEKTVLLGYLSKIYGS